MHFHLLHFILHREAKVFTDSLLAVLHLRKLTQHQCNGYNSVRHFGVSYNNDDVSK